MTRRACGIATTLLLLSFSVPVRGSNYTLHSPKLWSPQEKEQYEKENPPVRQETDPVEQQKERNRKEKEQAEKQKELLKKEKERAEKQKDQVKKEREQVRKQQEQLKKEMERVNKEKERIRQDQILVKNGVSYREVTVQKGDSLYAISRRFSKEGSSYAETLRFNNIDDPDQIVSGDIIKVPLNRVKAKQTNQSKQLKVAAPAAPNQITAKAAQIPVSVKPVVQQPRPFTGSTTARQKVIQPPEAAIMKSSADLPTAIAKSGTFVNISAPRQNLFEQAIRSYRDGDCQTAIQKFGRFLAEQNSSALAADASLLIADCYMKLSGK